MTVEMMDVIDNIAMSLILGILGIAITVFTVIYSFMESTKDRKRSLSDAIRSSNEVDPVRESDLRFAIQRLIDMRRMNYIVITIVVLDVLTFTLYAGHMIFKNISWLKLTSLVLLGILIALCVVAMVAYMVQYYNRFKGID